MKAWAIKMPGGGLYCGTWPTRAQAISHHVAHYVQELFQRKSREPGLLTALDDKQKAAWKDRRKRGDRAVKVEVREL